MKIAGKKFCGSHTTVIDAAEELARFVERQPEIQKISLGIIKKCGSSRGGSRIKIKEIPAGLEILVRGNKFVQTIYLYIDNSIGNSGRLTKILLEMFADK